jgi:F420-dependent oxidoreductase-like protein
MKGTKLMPEIAIMIEGQNGLNWSRWQRLALAVENLGFAGLYRSDHFTNARPPDLDSLELWISLAWLASHTQRIEFGPLVSPISFRHPTLTARMAAGVDDLSNGRLTLGLGAGWQEREHQNFGWELLNLPDRFRRFEEGLQVITKLLQCDTPVDFKGEYFQLQQAILLPRPLRTAGPPILIGGNGQRRTLPLVARYANEWNALFIPPGEFNQLNSTLDELLHKNERKIGSVRRSVMTGCIFGKTLQDVEKKVAIRTNHQRTPSELRQRGLIVGTGPEIIAQCQEYAAVGVQRLMLQWLDIDDIPGLEALADAILPNMV